MRGEIPRRPLSSRDSVFRATSRRWAHSVTLQPTSSSSRMSRIISPGCGGSYIGMDASPSGSRSGPRPPPRHRRSKRRFSSFLRRAHSRGHACHPATDAAGSRVDPGLSEKTRRPDPPARAGCAAHGLGSTCGCHRVRTSASIPRALSALAQYRMQHFTLQAKQRYKVQGPPFSAQILRDVVQPARTENDEN